MNNKKNQPVSKNQKKIQKKLNFNPILRFVLRSVLWISLLILLSSLSFIQNFLTAFTTLSLHSLLNLMGIPVNLSPPNVLQLSQGTGMKFSIIPDCTGIYPMVVLSGFILAFPASARKKVLGILGAIAASLSMNYLRMISLIAFAQISVRAFEIAHLLLWQSSFIVLVIAYFLWWMRWK